jgi:hypothetical protein
MSAVLQLGLQLALCAVGKAIAHQETVFVSPQGQPGLTWYNFLLFAGDVRGVDLCCWLQQVSEHPAAWSDAILQNLLRELPL